MRVVLIYNK